MKSLKSIVIVLLGAVLCSCSLPIPEPDFHLRPVQLKIIDEETGDPLQGINVFQIFSTRVYGGCGNFLVRMEASDSNYNLRSEKSDMSGTVIFDEKTYDFTCDEHPDTEYLVINLDLKPDVYTKYKSQFNYKSKAQIMISLGLSSIKESHNNLLLVNPEYRGNVIYGKSYTIEKIGDWWNGEQQNFDVQLNLDGFSRGPQSITVKLRKSK